MNDPVILKFEDYYRPKSPVLHHEEETEHPEFNRGVDFVLGEIRKIIGSTNFDSWEELKPILEGIYEDHLMLINLE